MTWYGHAEKYSQDTDIQPALLSQTKAKQDIDMQFLPSKKVFEIVV